MSFGSLFRSKSLASLSEDPLHEGRGLRRVLGPVDLILLGIGGIVGAGIFALVGSAAAGDATRLGAGPALIVSFILTGLACALAGLCYAEFASLAPMSGSAYTYAYATLGEIVAWIIGWDLILEYAVGNVAVAVSWSGYFCDFLHSVGIEFPRWLASDWRTAYSMATPCEVQARILTDAPQVWGVPLVFNAKHRRAALRGDAPDRAELGGRDRGLRVRGGPHRGAPGVPVGPAADPPGDVARRPPAAGLGENPSALQDAPRGDDRHRRVCGRGLGRCQPR